MLRNVLSRNVKRRRKALRLKQVELVRMTGVSQPEISNIERNAGKCNPTLENIDRLANGLNTTSWLLLAPWFEGNHSDMIPNLYRRFYGLSNANQDKVLGYINDLVLAQQSTKKGDT